MAIYVVILDTGEAFDVDVDPEGEWNQAKKELLGGNEGYVTATRWRKNNNPPDPTSGPFTEDNTLVFPVRAISYLAIDGLEF